MIYRLKHTLTIVVLIVFGLNAQPSDNVKTYTLRECVDLALQNNLNVRDAYIGEEAAAIALKRARHARYPSLNANSQVSLNFGRTVDPTTNDFVTSSFLSNNIGLNTGVTLFNAGNISNSIGQAKLDYQTATLDRDQMTRDVALLVTQNFLNVLFAKENHEINKQQLVLSKAQLEQIQKFIDAGVRPINEKLDIEAQIARNEQNLITTENAIIVNKLALKQLMRIDVSVDMDIEVPEGVNTTLDPDKLSFDEVYKMAIKTQPSIQASQNRIESARIGKRIAKSSLFPSVTLGGSLNTNYIDVGRRIIGSETIPFSQDILIGGQTVPVTFFQDVPILEDNPYFNQLDENLSYGFGLGITVPIYNNYQTKAAIQQAELNILRQENDAKRTEDNLKTNVQQALADAQAAKRALQAAMKSEEASGLAFENAKQRYELGAINPIDFTTSQNTYQTAQTNALIARYDYIFRIKVLDFYLGNQLNF